jgi:acetylornithine deacetylase/succinyl-diaminopimelate desuccinylase-like protein
VKLLRYKDTESGWRTLPQLNGEGDDKVEITPTTCFHIDVAKATVTMEDKGTQMAVGRQMVYMVV